VEVKKLEHKINGIFPCPVYTTNRNSDLTREEEIDIDKIIEEGMYRNLGNSSSDNAYIFERGKLKKLKQFCEQHLKIYVEQVISPKEELDFYITQSWLNITKPGESHHTHFHSNSIISGVFYVSTVEDDRITFIDPNIKLRELISFRESRFTPFNSSIWPFPVNNNVFVLFPSWLSHMVTPNEKATADRISISFNTFVATPGVIDRTAYGRDETTWAGYKKGFDIWKRGENAGSFA